MLVDFPEGELVHIPHENRVRDSFGVEDEFFVVFSGFGDVSELRVKLSNALLRFEMTRVGAQNSKLILNHAKGHIVGFHRTLFLL